ncbi:hypothetical protein [Inquilinus sp. CA228]|uniref:hypothetical protein n=1 Tax=Inquilinus sp. CA228 TaxID=3455609 RepID=UPI003F8D4CAC
MVRDRTLETWLRTEVAAAYDDMKADPSKGFSADDVLESLKAATKRRTKAG